MKKTGSNRLLMTAAALCAMSVWSAAASARGGGGGGIPPHVGDADLKLPPGVARHADGSLPEAYVLPNPTAPADREAMLQLLGIGRTRRGLESNGNGPRSANMTEEHVDEWPAAYAEAVGKPRPPHASTTLPELMVCKDGTKVTDAKTWNEKRRPEIVDDFEREVYGRIPKDVPKVTWQVVSNTVNGNVRTKTLRGHVDNSAYPQITVDIQASVSTPANATGPVPIIMTFGGGGGGGGAGGGRGRGAPGGAPPAGAPAAPGAPGAGLFERDNLSTALAALTTSEANLTINEDALFDVAAGGRGRGGAAGGGGSAQQMALSRGWGYASYANGSVQPNNWTGGIIGLTLKGGVRQPDEWGSLRAWGWGVSRVMDYFETDKDVNAKCVALEGHSFLGKTTIVSAVFEPRIANAFVSSSGEGGAKIYRRNFGEPAEGIGGTQEYYWMCGNWLKYCGPETVDDLPVDAHEFVALMAPRPVFISGGQVAGDGWQDPKGMYLAANLASPAWEIQAKKGLSDTDGKRITEFPQVEQPGQPAQFGPALIGGDIAYRQHNGGHVDAPNWPTFFDFLGHYWKTLPAAGPAADAPAQ